MKSTWLALFSLISEIYLRSTSLALGAQETIQGDKEHKRQPLWSDHPQDYVSPMHHQFYFPSEGNLEGKTLIVVSKSTSLDLQT